MRDITTAEILHCRGQLLEKVLHNILGKASLQVNDCRQFTSRTKLKDHVDEILVPLKIKHLHNKLVLQLLQNGYFRDYIILRRPK